VKIKITRKSLPELLREAGAPGACVYDRQAGAMRYVLPDGESMTPGEAAARYLPPCPTCRRVWPRCAHG
jgi:hypothetical protein